MMPIIIRERIEFLAKYPNLSSTKLRQVSIIELELCFSTNKLLNFKKVIKSSVGF